MRIRLSDHFTYKRLLRFVISPVLMMIFTSLYSIVDGFFVSNFVGKTPFAAVNLIMPVMMGIGTVGFMIGTGGSAIVSKTLGEGKHEQAQRYFSMLVYTAIIIGGVLSAAGFIFIRPISQALGATGELLDNCIVYGRILFLSMTAFILQSVFHSFFIAAEKPGLSLKVSVAAGLTNIILDYVFIAVFHWGIAGAAIATAIGEVIGGVVPILYFSRKNNSLLRLVRTRFEGRVLLKTCANGASEMVTNLSMAIVNILYNFQLMKLAGEDGIAAYGVIMYVNFIFMAIFLGYSIGSAPIVSYHYGAQNHAELKNLFKKSLLLVCGAGIILTVLAEVFSGPLVGIFVSYDAGLFEMTRHGFRLYALAFLMMGVNVWGSAFFTALNNGAVSAAISFLRTLVFQVSAVLILPLLLGVNGIWLAVVAAEALALAVTISFLAAKRKRYHYA
ncbi:MATE family efflux transporter [Christensenella tenuis]|uniref:Multidrug export protein MepA n=1 Tax=Christensenella tenuis TaxID=2763033 RepID=A0ABR7EFK3_9FIRM|nr:MATE family efflux transporter [Christensenella tenuis]MBC5648526.1 MATE family efflux transporter [Christensenella tenuis]